LVVAALFLTSLAVTRTLQPRTVISVTVVGIPKKGGTRMTLEESFDSDFQFSLGFVTSSFYRVALDYLLVLPGTGYRPVRSASDENPAHFELRSSGAGFAHWSTSRVELNVSVKGDGAAREVPVEIVLYPSTSGATNLHLKVTDNKSCELSIVDDSLCNHRQIGYTAGASAVALLLDVAGLKGLEERPASSAERN